MHIHHADTALRVIMRQLSQDCIMQIMAAAAAWISGVENARVQSNVRTNWSTEQIKTKIRSIGRTGHFTCDYVAFKTIIVFFHHVSSQSSAIPSPVILRYLRCSWSQLNNKIRTEHSFRIRLYSNPSCAIIFTHRPRISKRSVNVMKHIRCAVDSILPDAHSDAYISVNTETPKLARPSMWCAMKGLDYTHRHIRMLTRTYTHHAHTHAHAHALDSSLLCYNYTANYI